MAIIETDLGNVIGPQGPKGDTGVQGRQGNDGPPGPQGPMGKVDSTTPINFPMGGEREIPKSGDPISTLFQKTTAWFRDLGTAAFAHIANDLTTAVAGKVLDAMQGKVLDDKINNLKAELDKTIIDTGYRPQPYQFKLLLGERALISDTYGALWTALSGSDFFTMNKIAGPDTHVVTCDMDSRTITVRHKTEPTSNVRLLIIKTGL